MKHPNFTPWFFQFSLIVAVIKTIFDYLVHSYFYKQRMKKIQYITIITNYSAAFFASFPFYITSLGKAFTIESFKQFTTLKIWPEFLFTGLFLSIPFLFINGLSSYFILQIGETQTISRIKFFLGIVVSSTVSYFLGMLVSGIIVKIIY